MYYSRSFWHRYGRAIYIKFDYVYHYLDDLCIYSKDFDTHLVHLREVFSRIRKAGLTVKVAKENFATAQLRFLGHAISPAGVTIDMSRTQEIRELPPPGNI